MSSETVREALDAATTKAEVRSILDLHGRETFRSAWETLDPVVRGSLLLTRAFDGTVILDADFDGIIRPGEDPAPAGAPLGDAAAHLPSADPD